MLKFFPVPYPDEILYSILARYHIRSANLSYKVTLQELFGTTNVISTIDFQSHLQSLINNVQYFKSYTFENMVSSHTLFRYYAPFIPIKKKQAIYNLVKFDTRGMVHGSIGTTASSIKMPRFLRFCPQCLKEDYKKWGETYWHRLHQVPGVFTCCLHRCLLLDSEISLSRLNRHAFYPANYENCLADLKMINLTAGDINQLSIIAKEVAWLLSNNVEVPEDINWQQKYISILANKNLAKINGQVKQQDLKIYFANKFSANVLCLLDSAIHINSTTGWLSGIVRKHRKTFHPIRHILFLRAFGYSLKEFFNNPIIEVITGTRKEIKAKRFDELWLNNLKGLVSLKIYK